MIFLRINTRKNVSLIDPACNAGFEQLILNLSISTSTLFKKHFIIFLDDCEKDDKNDFECEMELMQELKRHENVIQLLGICKSMYQLNYFILRPSHSEAFLEIVSSLEQYYKQTPQLVSSWKFFKIQNSYF